MFSLQSTILHELSLIARNIIQKVADLWDLQVIYKVNLKEELLQFKACNAIMQILSGQPGLKVMGKNSSP